MIGAMPAVAVRHERRKGQEKRTKRPSQLYIGGHWLPPTSPSPTPSPNGANTDDGGGGGIELPEFYICGKVPALQVIVGAILFGAIVLIVGLVQLVPNAADADHRHIFIGVGGVLLVAGLIMTGVRCFCIHCKNGRVVMEDTAPPLDAVTSIDVLVQRRDTQITSPSELDALIGHSGRVTDDKEKGDDT